MMNSESLQHPQDQTCKAFPPRRLTASEALVNFARQTTAHGVKRLTPGDSVRQAVWSCLILIGCCGFFVHLSLLVYRYMMFPISTEFLTDELDIQFPTVTICPTDFIVALSPPIESKYAIAGRPRGLAHMINDVPRLFHQLELPPDWNSDVPAKAFSAYEDGKLALKAIAMRQRLVFQESHETVIYCRYNSGPCDYRNFSFYKDEVRFLCMSFSPINRTVVQPGEGNGLYLLLHYNATTFLTNEQQIDAASGFKVTLHEPGEKPDFSRAFNAPLGYKTSAQLTTTVDHNINRQPSPCSEYLPNVTYTWDYSRPGNFENVTFFGTLQDCVIRAKQEEFASECDCLGTHLAMPADMRTVWQPCHQIPEEFFFRNVHFEINNSTSVAHYMITNENWDYYPLTEYLAKNEDIYKKVKMRYLCFKTVRTRQSTIGLAARCKSRCLSTFHRVITTLATWPAVNSEKSKNEMVIKSYIEKVMKLVVEGNKSLTRLEKLHQQVSERLGSQFAVIDLHPRSVKATLSREEWAYPLRNLFSDIVGILGLWIGVSIITLIEILELAFQVSYLSVWRLSNRIREKSDRHVAIDGNHIDFPNNNGTRDIYSSPGDATYFQPAYIHSPQSGMQLGEFEVIEYHKSWFQRIFSL